MDADQCLRLYILMRNDLQSLVPGRCMAQAAHAANALVHDHGSHVMVKEWQRQTSQGFGTTIVLATSKVEIDRLFSLPEIKKWLVKGIVLDPDYVIRVTHEVASFIRGVNFLPESIDETTIAFSRPEVTCAYFLGTKKDLGEYLNEIPLY